jgi:hypothetical protein
MIKWFSGLRVDVRFNSAMLGMLFHPKKLSLLRYLHGDYKDVPEYKELM